LIEFKGSNDGIRLIIKKSATSEQPEVLREALSKKLAKIGSFLSGAQITAEIANEQLTTPIAEVIVSILGEYPDMYLKGIKCAGPEQEEEPGMKIPPGAYSNERDKTGSPGGPMDWVDFHLNTVRGGQSVHSPRSLVVLGSVNPGATITAVGNIYVSGNLGGVAHAGFSGEDDAWIYAGAMNPLQLRIGEHLARNSHQDATDNEPECAVVDDGRICVLPAVNLEDIALSRVRKCGPHLDVAENDG